MTILTKIQYTWPEGVTPIELPDWIKTLSQAEQDEYAQSLIRNAAIVEQEKINNNWSSDGYVEEFGPDCHDLSPQWAGKFPDDESYQNRSPGDPTWYSFWTRYQRETGVTVTEVVEII